MPALKYLNPDTGQWEYVQGPQGPQGAQGDSGVLNPMTGVGDMIIGGAAGAPTRLAPGIANRALLMTAGSPAWGQIVNALVAGVGTTISPSNGLGNVTVTTALVYNTWRRTTDLNFSAVDADFNIQASSGFGFNSGAVYLVTYNTVLRGPQPFQAEVFIGSLSGPTIPASGAQMGVAVESTVTPGMWYLSLSGATIYPYGTNQPGLVGRVSAIPVWALANSPAYGFPAATALSIARIV